MGIILITNLSNALVQTFGAEAMRGRVMGIYALAFFGLMPIGSLWVGQMAPKLGERMAVVMNAALVVALNFLIWLLAPEIKNLE